MADLSYSDLKKIITDTLVISSSNLKQVAEHFSILYKNFQTSACQKITISPVPNTCYKWIKSSNSDSKKILIFLHGGGYTMGCTEDHLELIAQLILQTNISVLSIDYRLCPDFQFPAPLNDTIDAYQWLLKQGYTAQQIGFSGISAGAFLATQAILQCQLLALPTPKIALILSGPINLNFNTPSCQYNLDRDWISTERLQKIKKYYLPENQSQQEALLNPAKQRYNAYPITLFQAGDYELLLDDSIIFFNALRKQHLPVYLQIVPELPHCWQFFAKAYRPGRTAISDASDFINQHF